MDLDNITTGTQEKPRRVVVESQVAYENLLEEIRPIREDLSSHLVYQRISDQRALRRFMESHIFAVWDFMSLLKSLQRQLTCVTSPWFIPASTKHARLINDIVLGEESDEVQPGIYMSHVELYLYAMKEVGADVGPFFRFIDALQSGVPVDVALSGPEIPDGVAPFVSNTLEMAKMKSHEVVAAFLFGREAIIPDMFRGILFESTIHNMDDVDAVRGGLQDNEMPQHAEDPRGPIGEESGLGSGLFQLYLERHIEVDEGSHGPMGEMLLKSLCGDSACMWEEALGSAKRALRARQLLWVTLAGHL